MDFSAIAELVQPEMLGRLQAQAEREPMSVTFYRCANGHQAAHVTRGTDPYPALARVGPGGECLRCLGALGERVVMM